jgi:hypothetical protein
VIALDAATVLVQWAAGGLFFLWVTTRRREVGIGYGWLLRGTYLVMLLGALFVAYRVSFVPAREVGGVLSIIAAAVALGVSITRRRAGVEHQRERVERRSARVAAMTGIDRDVQRFDTSVPEFPPVLDLITAVIALSAVVAAGVDAGSPVLLALARTIVGALFLGAISDAMLLGHWYLVQPGLGRAPLNELVTWTAIIWPFEVALLLWPVGMVSVLNGSIDDAYGGLLGWFWVACAITTIVLVFVTKAALRERAYSAVMAATGLLYLAILTAFGTDLIARALLS